MKRWTKGLVAGAAMIGFGAGLVATASAQWWGGGPWGGGPRGPGFHGRDGDPRVMTFDRQVMMRDHGEAMLDLKRMFDGRRSFDRRQAAIWAGEIEAGAGENLWRLYMPGSRARNSRALPRVWAEFDTFKGFAETLKNRAAALADELAERPTVDQLRRGDIHVPPMERYRGRPWGAYGGGPWGGPGRYGGRWGQRGGAMTKDSVAAFTEVVNACHQCHDHFRIAKWWR